MTWWCLLLLLPVAALGGLAGGAVADFLISLIRRALK